MEIVNRRINIRREFKARQYTDSYQYPINHIEDKEAFTSNVDVTHKHILIDEPS
jgi:hypothetical protein